MAEQKWYDGRARGQCGGVVSWEWWLPTGARVCAGEAGRVARGASSRWRGGHRAGRWQWCMAGGDGTTINGTREVADELVFTLTGGKWGAAVIRGSRQSWGREGGLVEF